MAEITAAAVGKLREMTNAGLMDCKKALTEANGDLDAAVDILRKKGAATAAKKAGREANEGVIAQYIAPGGTPGRPGGNQLRNRFRRPQRNVPAFCDDVAKQLAADPEGRSGSRPRRAGGQDWREHQISRHARMEVNGNGMIAAYIHTGAKVGVLVEVGAGKEATVAERRVQATGARHHAANRRRPSLRGLARTSSRRVIAKEKEIAAQSTVKDKPPQAIAKIVEGKLEKFYQTYCLVDQGFVKKNSEVTVKEHVGSVAKQLGDEITIRRFVRFQVGETPAAQ